LIKVLAERTVTVPLRQDGEFLDYILPKSLALICRAGAPASPVM